MSHEKIPDTPEKPINDRGGSQPWTSSQFSGDVGPESLWGGAQGEEYRQVLRRIVVAFGGLMATSATLQ